MIDMDAPKLIVLTALVSGAATLWMVGEIPKLEQRAELTQCLNTLERERMQVYMEQYRRQPQFDRVTAYPNIMRGE